MLGLICTYSSLLDERETKRKSFINCNQCDEEYWNKNEEVQLVQDGDVVHSAADQSYKTFYPCNLQMFVIS